MVWLVGLCALTGIGVSLVLLLGSHARTLRVVHPVLRVCGMDGDGCLRVVRHPDARLFGVSNAALGLFYYAAVLGGAIIPLPPALAGGLLVASWVAAGTSVFLLLSLRYRVRARCPLCRLAHALNGSLALLLTLLHARLL